MKPGGWQLEQAGGRAEVPTSVLLSGEGKSLLGEHGNFLVVYISGLRNKNLLQ